MNLTKAAAAYRRTHVASSPGRILEALLRRLRRDLEDAKGAIEVKDFAGKGKAISHALAILGELDAALDHASAPELCGSLASLYGFVEQRLVAASARMDPGLIDEAGRVLSTLEEAFCAALSGASGESGEAST